MKVKSILVLLIAMIFTLYIMNISFSGDKTTSSYFTLEKPLKTEEAKATDITGVFTLILYGGRYSDDIETIAILDYEGDQFTFEPYVPEFDYRVRNGIPAKEALDEAEKFVSFHNSFHRSILSRIVDNKGNTIGFEMRPLYLPYTFGVSDVLEVDYWLKEGNKVKVTIRLTPSVERMRFHGGGGEGE